MAFVERSGGSIVAVYASIQPGFAEEELADNDAEILAFYASRPPEQLLNAHPVVPHANLGGF